MDMLDPKIEKNLPENPRIFISTNTYTGAMGGISGADSICNSDTNKPTARTYKAMLWSSTRNIYSNWVLRANTDYYRQDGTTYIGRTDSTGKLIFPLTNSIGSAGVYTGVSSAGDIADVCCSDWNSTSGSGVIGGAGNLDFQAIKVNSVGCTSSYKIYCVEQ